MSRRDLSISSAYFYSSHSDTITCRRHISHCDSNISHSHPGIYHFSAGKISLGVAENPFLQLPFWAVFLAFISLSRYGYQSTFQRYGPTDSGSWIPKRDLVLLCGRNGACIQKNLVAVLCENLCDAAAHGAGAENCYLHRFILQIIFILM